jgi:hypothetical protein
MAVTLLTASVIAVLFIMSLHYIAKHGACADCSGKCRCSGNCGSCENCKAEMKNSVKTER